MLSRIQVPRRFLNGITASKWAGALAKTLDGFAWLPSRALELFPDFTDHGPEHLSQVLSVAERLIGPKTWRYLTPDDAVAFILAVLLHDLGMHVTSEGFAALMLGRSEHQPISFFNSKSWPAVWADFRGEASRFDGRQNIELFGAAEPVSPPDLSNKDWTENQRRLAGECLRRHHARLAHEIALHGFPGPPDQSSLRIDDGLLPLADLAGVIARSHGIKLRLAVEYLQERYNNAVSPLNVHAPFLMGLLRVSDYLQMSPDRAPEVRLRVQSLRSPISQREWKKHIIHVSFEGEDPESMYVQCEPSDVETYLGVKTFLLGFQTEMDCTWAVLGEVYRDGKFALSRRRIRSNLDARGWRAPQEKYVPMHARFDSANPQLLNHLVGPLYEYDVAFGIRELMQNAVDAVREMRALGRYKNLRNTPDVLFDLREDSLTVQDRGVGMTADTVVNYFLRAGASFRDSDAWKRDFLDHQGLSRVLRSGRFGIGALAAFLVGPTIEVFTRHWSARRGLAFKATIHDDPIELRPCDCDIGTRIRIPLTRRQYSLLRWQEPSEPDPFDWFRFKWPRVRVAKDSSSPGAPCALDDQLWHKPGATNDGWVRADVRGLQLQWRRTRAGGSTVNGFRIRHGYINESQRFLDSSGTTYECDVCWWDPDGRLQIDLKRTRLADMEATPELLEAFARNWIASALAHPDPTLDPVSWLDRPAPSPDPWLWTEQGLLLYDLGLIDSLKPQKVLIFHRPNQPPPWPGRSNAARRRPGLPEPSAYFCMAAHFEDASEYYPKYPLLDARMTWIGRVWIDLLGEHAIPYALADRLVNCGKAYDVLAAEVKHWTGWYGRHTTLESTADDYWIGLHRATDKAIQRQCCE